MEDTKSDYLLKEYILMFSLFLWFILIVHQSIVRKQRNKQQTKTELTLYSKYRLSKPRN